MEKFYDALRRIKKMEINIPNKNNSKKFCAILHDLAPDYISECSWLERIMQKEIHLEFVDKKDARINEKKQIVSRVRKQLEIEEGFGEKAVEEMLISLMIIGDWQESYDEIINWEKELQVTEKVDSMAYHNRIYPDDINQENLIAIAASRRGRVSKLYYEINASVSKGEPIAMIKSATVESEVIAPQNGIIVSILEEGELVNLGDVIAFIEVQPNSEITSEYSSIYPVKMNKKSNGTIDYQEAHSEDKDINDEYDKSNDSSTKEVLIVIGMSVVVFLLFLWIGLIGL